MNRSTFWTIKYINGSIFSKARYMNGVRFEILARTPIAQLPPSYPPRENKCLTSSTEDLIISADFNYHILYIKISDIKLMYSKEWL